MTSKSVKYIRANGSKLIKSLLCFTSYAGMGSAFTLLGSCLLDYQILINEDFNKVSFLVQERAIGYIFGALLSGSILNCSNKVITLSLTNLILGLSLIVSPFLTNFILLSAATLIGGVTLGFLEIYCNVYIALIWQKGSTNYLQALHFFFDIGALIAPLITRPFLLPMDVNEYNNQRLRVRNSTEIIAFTADDVLIQYPHLILGVFLVAVSVLFALVYINYPDHEQADNRQETTQIKTQFAKWKRFTAIVLTALIVNFEFGGQNLVSALGPAFAVKSDLGMDKQQAALLVTVYWAVCCVYRIFLIPLTIYFSETKLIIFNVLIIIAGASTMVAGADHNESLAWISFSLLSMGFAPCFAFSFGLIQKYFYVSNRVTSLIFFFGTLGESIHPWIVANYLELYSSFYTIYFASMAFINSALLIILVAFVFKFFEKDRNEYHSL